MSNQSQRPPPAEPGSLRPTLLKPRMALAIPAVRQQLSRITGGAKRIQARRQNSVPGPLAQIRRLSHALVERNKAVLPRQMVQREAFWQERPEMVLANGFNSGSENLSIINEPGSYTAGMVIPPLNLSDTEERHATPENLSPTSSPQPQVQRRPPGGKVRRFSSIEEVRRQPPPPSGPDAFKQASGQTSAAAGTASSHTSTGENTAKTQEVGSGDAVRGGEKHGITDHSAGGTDTGGEGSPPVMCKVETLPRLPRSQESHAEPPTSPPVADQPQRGEGKLPPGAESTEECSGRDAKTIVEAHASSKQHEDQPVPPPERSALAQRLILRQSPLRILRRSAPGSQVRPTGILRKVESGGRIRRIVEGLPYSTKMRAIPLQPQSPRNDPPARSPSVAPRNATSLAANAAASPRAFRATTASAARLLRRKAGSMQRIREQLGQARTGAPYPGSALPGIQTGSGDPHDPDPAAPLVNTPGLLPSTAPGREPAARPKQAFTGAPIGSTRPALEMAVAPAKRGSPPPGEVAGTGHPSLYIQRKEAPQPITRAQGTSPAALETQMPREPDDESYQQEPARGTVRAVNVPENSRREGGFDPTSLARQVLPIIKRILAQERERRDGVG